MCFHSWGLAVLWASRVSHVRWLLKPRPAHANVAIRMTSFWVARGNIYSCLLHRNGHPLVPAGCLRLNCGSPAVFYHPITLKCLRAAQSQLRHVFLSRFERFIKALSGRRPSAIVSLVNSRTEHITPATAIDYLKAMVATKQLDEIAVPDVSR